MLQPVQTSGQKPPLFLVHGLNGDMTAGAIFAGALGPDRPLYAIQANGMDGRQPTIDNVPDMVRAYIEQIRSARPTGPIRIGGFCAGSLVAMEIAHALQEMGRQVGPVIVIDPAPVPPGYNENNRAIDTSHPTVARFLYESVRIQLLRHASNRSNSVPFDPSDFKQMHNATLAGVACLVAFHRYMPKPFSGAVEAIVSASWAVKFLDPELPWHSLLLGPRMVHVVPWDHRDLFVSGYEHIARFVGFLLEEPPGWGARPAVECTLGGRRV